ncbi:unnamed protein product, partial [Musa acuminata subsp. burmannicoides]
LTKPPTSRTGTSIRSHGGARRERCGGRTAGGTRQCTPHAAQGAAPRWLRSRHRASSPSGDTTPIFLSQISPSS